jgi:integrase family protein with SAM-like domain
MPWQSQGSRSDESSAGTDSGSHLRTVAHRGTLSSMSNGPSSPVDEYMNWVRTSEQLTTRTQRAYVTHLRRLETHCSTNGLRIEDLSEMELRSYLAPFQLDRSPQARLTALRRFYAFRQTKRYRDDNPMAGLRELALPRGRFDDPAPPGGLALVLPSTQGDHGARDGPLAHLFGELREPDGLGRDHDRALDDEPISSALDHLARDLEHLRVGVGGEAIRDELDRGELELDALSDSDGPGADEPGLERRRFG